MKFLADMKHPCLRNLVRAFSRHPCVRESIKALRQIADPEVRFRDQTIPDSARRIQTHAAELC